MPCNGDVMRGPSLTRKALRDLWQLRGPALAIAIVTMCGVAAFVSLRSMVRHLEQSQTQYYASNRFGQLFAAVRRAPRAVLTRVAALPGVEAVDGWVTGDVLVDVPALAEPATGRIVGLLPYTPSRVNRVSIVRGRAPAAGSRHEVVLSEGFASANQLEPGDTLAAVLNGTRRSLRVTGIGLSPEYIYEISPGAVLPDARRYGILWMDRGVVELDFGMTGAWNTMALRLAPGASASATRDAIDVLLEPYGGYGANDRDRHASHRYVTEEIGQNRATAAVLPPIFLGVAAFLISIVLARIVQSQREQIGMLKAFGADTPLLIRHYLFIALVPVSIGALLGVALGLWAAQGIAGMYREYFHFPFARFTPDPRLLMLAMAIALAAGALGATAAVRRVARLAPADAMRPEPPPAYTRGLVERLGLDRVLRPVGRMTARAMLARPLRAGLSVLGLGLGGSVMIVGLFTFDAIDRLRTLQFEIIERGDVQLTFDAARGPGVVHALARLPGVLRVEATHGLAVRLHHGQRSRQLQLAGIRDGDALHRIITLQGARVPAPAFGIMLNTALADLLDVQVGDTVHAVLVEGRRSRHPLVVRRIIEDMIGTSAWVNVTVLQDMAASTGTLTGANLLVDPRQVDDLYASLKRTPGIRGVVVRRAMRESFDALVRRSFSLTLGTLVAFACTLAVGVVYNSARLALAERSRELASLRVLGFTQAEVGRMLLGEQAVLTLASWPVGAALGALLAWATVQAMGSTELWRMPLVIRPRTFGYAALLIAVASVLAGLLVRRQLDRVNLIEVLKTRE